MFYVICEDRGFIKRTISGRWQSRLDLSSHSRFFHGIKLKVNSEGSHPPEITIFHHYNKAVYLEWAVVSRCFQEY
ncbi:hypothetical protein ScPMuIL_004719 [Solemya velum]